MDRTQKDILYIEPKQIEYIKTLIEAGGVVPLNVTGFSMRPFFSYEGDTVYLEKVEGCRIKKGDILLFVRDNGCVVLHRVRKIIGPTLRMNGDAQNWCEDIKYSNVVGKVVKYTHKGKEKNPDKFSMKFKRAVWNTTYSIRPYIFALAAKIKR